MSNRRRGKSVVLDSLPSLVTTEGDSSLLSRKERGRLHVNREALREIIMVLVGLILVVWLFFGGQNGATGNHNELSHIGSRPMQFSDTPYIYPAHFGAITGTNPRDGVKKAPGDKQKSGAVEAKSTKKQAGTIFQYHGSRSPDLVIVTVVDDIKHPRDYNEKIIENRLEYAQAHNYGLLIKFASELSKFVEESHNHQSSWARVALALEAQTTFPEAKWIWQLSDQSLIMQPSVDLLSTLLTPENLESNMQRGVSVMRFENTHIRTYFNNRIEDVSYILTRNSRGISTDSFIFKNNLYSRIWLELWGEPLYRSFGRFSNEEEALGHIMQWHTQFLVRTAVVDPHLLGTVAIKDTTFDDVWQEVQYKDRDFVAILTCDFAVENCKRDFQLHWNARSRIQPAVHAQQAASRENMPHGQNFVQNQVQVQAQEKAQEKAEQAAAQAQG